MLLLNITEIFDNVLHTRLLHNLKKRKIDNNMTNWILSFLFNRSIIISLSKFTSEVFKTGISISQELLISLILYLFYNINLMKEDEKTDFKVTDLSYINDVAKMIIEFNMKLNCRRIEDIFAARKNQWSKRHASKFASVKFQLIHFKKSDTRVKQLNQSENDTLHLKNHTIKSQETEIYLNVLLDKKLKWIAQLRCMKTEILKAINALSSLEDSTWNASLLNLRKIYLICIVSKLLYTCSLWYSFDEDFNIMRLKRAIIKSLIMIQRCAAQIIAEAFRNISKSTLNMKLHLIFVKYMLKKTFEDTLIKLWIS